MPGTEYSQYVVALVFFSIIMIIKNMIIPYNRGRPGLPLG